MVGTRRGRGGGRECTAARRPYSGVVQSEAIVPLNAVSASAYLEPAWRLPVSSTADNVNPHCNHHRHHHHHHHWHSSTTDRTECAKEESPVSPSSFSLGFQAPPRSIEFTLIPLDFPRSPSPSAPFSQPQQHKSPKPLHSFSTCLSLRSSQQQQTCRLEAFASSRLSSSFFLSLYVTFYSH